MSEWTDLADDMKMCVTIHNELKVSRPVWFTRLAELLKADMGRHDISKLEDRLMDLGILDKQYEKVDGKWTNCYRICSEAASFIENVADNTEKVR